MVRKLRGGSLASDSVMSNVKNSAPLCENFIQDNVGNSSHVNNFYQTTGGGKKKRSLRSKRSKKSNKSKSLRNKSKSFRNNKSKSFRNKKRRSTRN